MLLFASTNFDLWKYVDYVDWGPDGPEAGIGPPP